MADPSSYRPKPGQIPDSPGVYKFRDEHRRVIYVGKAKSLRQRLASYFQDLANLHPRSRTMVRPFSRAHQAAANRAGAPPLSASSRRAGHSRSGQPPGTIAAKSSRANQNAPAGVSTRTRPSRTVAGAWRLPPLAK